MTDVNILEKPLDRIQHASRTDPKETLTFRRFAEFG